jgi:hemerythrin-like domain-containing protein
MEHRPKEDPMTQTLPQVAREHHERLLLVVDGLPAVADALLKATPEEASASIASVRRFLAGTLVPHVDSAEQTLYGELERMYQNRHSMAPMRREHEEVRRLVAALAALADRFESGHDSPGNRYAARRVLFTLYALLKVHLAEEEAYLRVVEHGVSDEVAGVLAAALEHPVVRPT